MIPTIRYLGKGKTMETEERPVVAQGKGKGRDKQAENRGFLGQ